MYMKYRCSYLICCVVVLSFHSSCVSNNYNKQLFSNPITFPDSLYIIEGSKQKAMDPNKYTLVVYVDSSECCVCKIRNVKKFNKIAESYHHNIIVLASPSKNDIEILKQELLYEKCEYPVYIDLKNTFNEINQIPEDKRAHTFIIDDTLLPIHVGDPTTNIMQRVLFKLMLLRTMDGSNYE